MTPADLAVWRLVQRKVAGLTPDMAAAVLKVYAKLAEQLVSGELEAALLAALNARDMVALSRVLDAIGQADNPAYLPVKEQIRRTMASGVKYASRSIPAPPSGRGPIGFTGGSIGVRFDLLSPHVLDAVRSLETKVVTSISADAKATVLQVTERGLTDGVNPRAIAKDLRSVIGLGPAQEQQVANFRDALRGENGRNFRDYLARDKRFDGTVTKALSGDGTKLSDAQIEKMVDAYRRKRVALNAETTARTATLDSMKAGQRAAWVDARHKGIVKPGELWKVWKGVMDDRERPEHVAMEGETVPFDQPFSNGEVVPGSSTFNCRCLAEYIVKPAAA